MRCQRPPQSCFAVTPGTITAVLSQATAFHEDFAAALASAGNAYATAEAANASGIASAVQSLLGGGATPALLGGGSAMAMSPLQGTTVGLILGGSGLPIPPPSYVSAILNYVNQNFSVLPADAQALFSPEGFYPLVGFKTLTLAASVSQGVQILDTAIKQQLAADPSGSVAVSGVSQSAVISSLEMENLANPALTPTPPTANQLGFTLLGDLMNPNGGLLARFPGFPAGQPLQFPSLGITFYGATPSNTHLPDSHLHAGIRRMGRFPAVPDQLHFRSERLRGHLACAWHLRGLESVVASPWLRHSAIADVSGLHRGYHLHMITTPNGLPLLDPVRAIPVIGNPIADLLQPDLTTIVNLGYGSPSQGWSTGYANVPTQFGLFPTSARLSSLRIWLTERIREPPPSSVTSKRKAPACRCPAFPTR